MSEVQEVWIPSKEFVWVRSTIQSINAETQEVVCQNPLLQKEKVTLKLADVHIVDITHLIDSDDLCSMNRLHEAPLLDTLRRRFLSDKVYTTTDSVLISINPYKKVEGLYEQPCLYLDIPEISSKSDPSALPVEPRGKGLKPHVFKIANDALCSMVTNGDARFNIDLHDTRKHVNQSVIVSGESGAGKTEASKYVMSFLIAADGEIAAADENSDGEPLILGTVIKNALVGSNVIFEAFGNAKTIRNDNSSRFGKYIKLEYTSGNRLVSATTETFLLEKSRLVDVGLGEGNYHVFSSLVRGMEAVDPVLARRLGLAAGGGRARPHQFKMLLDAAGNHNHCEIFELTDLLSSLENVGCSADEQVSIMTLLGCLLHLGNVTFEGESPVEISSPSMPLAEIGALIGVSGADFVKSLTEQHIQAGGRTSVHNKTLGAAEARNNMSALCKWIYASLFAWLVKKINNAHASLTKTAATAVDEQRHTRFIGILDIFGFEILMQNSFEQLCINFTNERLQQQFNEYVFILEQQEYALQGLQWTTISFQDNQAVIDLISLKSAGGLFHLLEEAGMLQRNNAAEGDSGLLASFHARHAGSKLLSKSRFDTGGTFGISHYAGTVEYKIANFLSKNNDSLQDDLVLAMMNTRNDFFYNVIIDQCGVESLACRVGPGFLPTSATTSIAQRAGGGAGASKKMAATITVSYQFRRQLDQLMQTLTQTEPHYIKCMKPNSTKSPLELDSPLLVQQLRYSGAMEVVRIRREGFPWSARYLDFCTEFELLTKSRLFRDTFSDIASHSFAPDDNSSEALRNRAMSICRTFLPSDSFAPGSTKLFLRDGTYDALLLHHAKVLGAFAAVIQARVRGNRQLALYKLTVRAIIVVQAHARFLPKRKQFLKHLKTKSAELIEQRRIAECLRLAKEKAMAIELAEAEAYQREQERLMEIVRQRQVRCDYISGLHAYAARGEMQPIRTAAVSATPGFGANEEAPIIDHSSASGLQSTSGPVITDLFTLRDGAGRTLLHTAAIHGQIGTAVLLNPSLDQMLLRCDKGYTALHYAILGGDDSGTRAKRGQKLAMVSMLLFACDPALDLGAAFRSEAFLVDDACSNLPLPPPNELAHMTLECVPLDNPARHAAVESFASSRPVSMSIKSQQKAAAVLLGTKGGSKSVAQSVDGEVLKEGWLSKRGEKLAWRRRYIKLTSDSLMYFHSERDTKPRDCISLLLNLGAMQLERFCGPGAAPAVSLKLAAVSGKKQRTKIDLMAESEKEMQAWLTPLRALAGLVGKNGLRVGSGAGLPPVRYFQTQYSQALLRATTSTLMSVMHILAANGSTVEDFVLAAYLLDLGAGAAGLSADKKSPLQLIQQRAALTCDSKTGIAALGSLFATVPLPQSPRLPPFIVLPAYSYLSIFFAWSNLPAGSNQSVAIVATLNDRAGAATENPYTCHAKAQEGDGSFIVAAWGSTMFMQTPLDAIDGHRLIIQVNSTSAPLGWAEIDISRDRVNSGMITVPLRGIPEGKEESAVQPGSGLTAVLSIYRR